MKRFALILCLAALFRIQAADFLLFLGRDLQYRGNLPHRALGVIFAAHLLEPTRKDYEMEYLSMYFNNSNDYSLIEGQVVPVVPMMAAQLAKENLDDDQCQAWSHFFRQWVFNKRATTKLTMSLHADGETITAEVK